MSVATAETIGIYQVFEAHMFNKMGTKNEEIDDLTQQLQKVHHALSLIAQETDESRRIDWSNDPVKMALLDEIREFARENAMMDNFELTEPGVYSWEGDKITRLSKQLNNYNTTFIAPKIQQKMQDLGMHQSDITAVTNMMNEVLKMDRDFSKTIGANIRASR